MQVAQQQAFRFIARVTALQTPSPNKTLSCKTLLSNIIIPF